MSAVKIENSYRDVTDERRTMWSNTTYEIEFRIPADARTAMIPGDPSGKKHKITKSRKAILQACSKEEAIGIFKSLPQLAGTNAEIVGIKGVNGDVYFI